MQGGQKYGFWSVFDFKAPDQRLRENICQLNRLYCFRRMSPRAGPSRLTIRKFAKAETREMVTPTTRGTTATSCPAKIILQPQGIARIIHGRLAKVNPVDRTKQKSSKFVQLRSAELFRAAFAQASVGLALTDAKARFVHVNKAYGKMTGFAQEELYSRRWSSMIHPADRSGHMRFVKQLLRGDASSMVIQQRYIKKSGDVVWVQDSVSAFRDAGADSLNLIILTEDITGQKRAEDERALLASIVQSSEDAIIGRKLDGTIISWNAGAERIFGYKAEEALGRLYSFLVPPDRPDELEAIVQKILRGERIEHYESVRLARGGKLVDISLSVSPIKDAGGTLVGLSVVGRDITIRKRGEAERTRLTFQLDERIKELTAMYGVVHLLQMEGNSIASLLKEVATLLASGWRYPKFTGVRIQWGGFEVKTDNFRPTPSSQQAVFTTADGRKGNIEVVYLSEHRPEADNNPFLAEERNLIDAVAENLKVYLDRKHLESEILEISEREQRRIGQDLHDGLSQHLRGIAYLSHVLAENIAQKSLPGARDARRITQLLNQAIRETHGLAQGLFPIRLEADGLMAALKVLASDIKNTYKISCRLVCRKPVLVDDGPVAINLFRIAQEAVQNAIKHGKATRIMIRLLETSESIELAVKDNGSGLPEDFELGRGMGLKIMDHRAGAIGADLQVQRVEGGGTLMTCSLRRKA
jgi:PAS domain S-box-containing protein